MKHTITFSRPVTVEMIAHSAADECDSFQIIVLVNCFEYKIQTKNKECQYKTVYFLQIISPKLCTWHAIYSCNTDRASTVTSQQAFNSSSNFDPEVLCLPFTCHKIM
jgi:hypothetical protein